VEYILLIIIYGMMSPFSFESLQNFVPGSSSFILFVCFFVYIHLEMTQLLGARRKLISKKKKKKKKKEKKKSKVKEP